MTKNYKSKISGIPHFLTFTVVKWLSVFAKKDYMKILWDSLQYCRQKKGMRLYAFVFMTNHIHLIVSAEKTTIKLWEIIRDFKKFTAQKIIQLMQKEESCKQLLSIMRKIGRKNKANVQYQFWIQNDGAKEIYSDNFLEQKMEYIHLNPVKAGMVTEPEHYLYSSARFYAKNDFHFIDKLDTSARSSLIDSTVYKHF